MKTSFLGITLLGLSLSSCVTTETHYKTVNNMSYCENCKAIIVSNSETEKIKLPGGGYAGATVDLGSIEKSQTRGEVSRSLGVINQAIVSACEGQKAAAFANDPAAYKNWAMIQQNQIVKLEQLEGLLAAGETSSSTPAATPAPAAAAAVAQPAAVAEATPKPAAAKKDAKLKKWASVYSPKTQGKVKLPAGTKVEPAATAAAAPVSGAAPTPPVVTAAVKAVLETQPKYPQVLGLPAK